MCMCVCPLSFLHACLVPLKLTDSARDGTRICSACWLQFHVLREKGTEPPGSGKYDKFYEKGVYKCAGCGSVLYKCVLGRAVNTEH